MSNLFITGYSQKKAALKFNPKGKMPPKKCSQGTLFPLTELPQKVQVPFKKAKLYLRRNKMESIIRPRNLKELLSVRCC